MRFFMLLLCAGSADRLTRLGSAVLSWTASALAWLGWISAGAFAYWLVRSWVAHGFDAHRLTVLQIPFLLWIGSMALNYLALLLERKERERYRRERYDRKSDRL